MIKERERFNMALTPEQIEWLHDNGKNAGLGLFSAERQDRIAELCRGHPASQRKDFETLRGTASRSQKKGRRKEAGSRIRKED